MTLQFPCRRGEIVKFNNPVFDGIYGFHDALFSSFFSSSLAPLSQHRVPAKNRASQSASLVKWPACYIRNLSLRVKGAEKPSEVWGGITNLKRAPYQNSSLFNQYPYYYYLAVRLSHSFCPSRIRSNCERVPSYYVSAEKPSHLWSLLTQDVANCPGSSCDPYVL